MEQQLKKAEQDCERLNQELATLQQSIPVSKSVKSLVEYIEGRPEPFAADYKRDQNPYANSNPNPGCCTVM